MKKVIVIGGGCAGLSAATALAEQNIQVEVYEKSRILGGRTSSVPDPETHEPVDNGQHMFLGCYQETNRFLERIGASSHVKYRDCFETLMMGKNGEKAFLKTYRLPAPFHLLVGYLGYKAFSLSERLSIIHVVHGLKKYSDRALQSMHCTDFLEKCKQSKTTQERFWNLLILATLNVAPEKVSADMLKVVLEQGFMSSRKDSASGLANIGLTPLFGDHASAYLEKMGGQVHSKQTVRNIVIAQNQVTGVALENGESRSADAVISAVAPNHLQRLVEKYDALRSELDAIQTLQPSPIVSLHIWTDRELFDDAYIGFWDTPFHWVFRKQSFMQDTSISHYTLVASGADDLVRAPTDKLVAMAQETLEPLCGKVFVKRAKKSLMKNATWIPPLGNQKGRLNIQSKVSGLYFAGDWVDTGLPCTIESAAVSGHLAASYIKKKFL